LRFYAQAFHLAGRRLAEQYGTTGAVRDFEACPVVFLYRHAFELYLKDFIIGGARLLSLRRKNITPPPNILKTHNLGELAKGFERVIEGVEWDWDWGSDGLRTREEFFGLVGEFCSVDKGSFAFRYPMGTDGTPVLPQHFAFSLRQFTVRMDALLELLDGGAFGLDAMYQQEEEMLSDMYSTDLE